MESIARNHYAASSGESKDPVTCSLFYLAMGRKNVLIKLWQSSTSHPEQTAMLKFLANDFALEKWRIAASKNAFALLGKQRYGEFGIVESLQI